MKKGKVENRDEVSLWKLISLVLFALLVVSLITAGFRGFLDSTGSAARVKVQAATVEKPLVELFVMSKCPFGVNSELLISKVKGLLGDKFSLRVYYIASENPDGTFSSLHGQEEVDENIRQLCIVNYYPNKFLDYLDCINKDYIHADKRWETCAKENYISIDNIESCWHSSEGRNLLRNSIEEASTRNIESSPTMFVNGLYYQGHRTAEAFKEAICGSFTEKPKECKTSLGKEEELLSGANIGSC